MEIAFISSNRLKVELDRKRDLFPSGIISIFTQKPSIYIASTLLGNNISIVIYGLFMAVLLDPLISTYIHSETWILTIQTIISTIVVLVFAEFLPKTVFRINPNASLKIFAIPILFFYFLFYPFTIVIIQIANIILKVFFKLDLKKTNSEIAFSKIDLDHYLQENTRFSKQNEEIEADVKIFRNALDLSNIKLRECIVPRTEIEAIDVNDTINHLQQKFIETGLSKILIYRDSIDNIIGYTHLSELFKNPTTIDSILHKLIIVPETMAANKLLSSLIQKQKSIALVVDEFGGTSGIVTIEDIIEEIFGEIEDEYDSSDLREEKISQDEYIFSGRHEIDYLNDKYNLNLQISDEYETIAGYILYNYGNIPRINEIIKINPYSFKIIEATKTRIKTVLVKKIITNKK